MRKDMIKTALSAFAEGVFGFVSFPFIRTGRTGDTLDLPRRAARQPDISRYFGAVGKYISDSCDKFGESVK